MSGVFHSVMRELAAGSSARTAARNLGISLDLTQAVADEATRMGLIVTGSAACGTCVPKSSPACAGCPFVDGPAATTSVVSAPVLRRGAMPVTLIAGREAR